MGKAKSKASRKNAPMKKAKKRRKKRRGSAAKRNASREVMNRPVKLSAELAEVVGSPALSRPEAVKRLWAYCKKNHLLNPKDQREILCDARLKKLLGKKSTTMFGLSGLLVPHFDFSVEVDEAEDMGEEEDDEEEEDEEAEEDAEISNEHECQDIAQSVTLSIVRLQPGSVALSFIAPTRHCKFEAVATPANNVDMSATIRIPCSVQIFPASNGDVESRGEVTFEGLDPACGYKIAIEVSDLHSNSSSPEISRKPSDSMSPEIEIPQCAHPRRWSSRDVQLWCRSIQAFDLAQKTKKYGVDGPTLLSFTEEDLRGIGISTPLVLRRVLSALAGLGGG